MASPFHYFRKHQKQCFAILTVFIVFVFVVGSALQGNNRGDSDRGQQVVATWNGGEMTAEKLGMLVRNRRITSQFLRGVVGRGIEAGGEVADIGLPTDLTNALVVDPQAQNEQLEGLVLGTEIASGLADGAGITVTDGVVNEILTKLGNQRVESNEVSGILKAVTGSDAPGAEAVVFNTIKKVVQAYFYQQSFGDAAATVLPAQRWEQWLRTNERVALQVAVIPADSFVTEVEDPTDAQVASFYEEFKDRDPDGLISVGGVPMPSPDPGFANPRRVTLHFIKGAVVDRTEKLLDTITDQEIADYYEANKRYEFVKSELPGEDDETAESESEDAAASGESADAASDEKSPADEPAADSSSDDKSDTEATADESTSEASATEDSKVDDATEPAAADAAKPAADGQGTTSPADESAADGEAAGESQPATETAPAKDGAANTKQSPFRLVAFQTETPAAEKPADASAEATEEKTAAADDESEDGAETEGAAPAADQAVDAPAATDEEGEEEEEPEYEPLESVKEDIRRELARRKAIDEIQSDMGKAYELLRSKYAAHQRAVSSAEQAKQDLPELPDDLTDLASIADKYGFEFEKTAPLTYRELVQDTQVGQAIEVERQSEVVANAAFGTLRIGEPYQAREALGDGYVVIKVADEPHTVPKLDKVRDKVVAAWKRHEAAKLAEKKAQELAAAAKSGDKSFAELVGNSGYRVIDPTEQFTWQTFGLVAADQLGPPRISTIPGIDNVANDFMKTVFSLKDDEVGTAMSVDRSTAYVFRIASRERTLDELKQAFLASGWNVRDQRVSVPIYLMQQAGAMAAQRGINERVGLKIDPEWEAMRKAELEARQ